MPYAISIAVIGVLIAMGIIIFAVLRETQSCVGMPNVSLCQYRSVEKYLENDDISAALNAIATFSASNHDFYACHALMHMVGSAVYRDYERGQSFVSTEQISMCSYGFFHGFMESLLAATHNFREATAVCTGIGKAPLNIPREECFHGIGHGMVDQHIPDEWKDVTTILTKSSKLCKAIMGTQIDFDKCMGGVYNAIANAYWQKEYGLMPDFADPFSLCRIAPTNSGDCYMSMARTLLDLPPYTFASAVQFIQANVPEKFQNPAISGLAVMSSPRTDDQSGIVKTCESLQPSFRVGCVSSLAQGIMYSGDVKEKKGNALEICARSNDTLVYKACLATVNAFASK